MQRSLTLGGGVLKYGNGYEWSTGNSVAELDINDGCSIIVYRIKIPSNCLQKKKKDPFQFSQS